MSRNFELIRQIQNGEAPPAVPAAPPPTTAIAEGQIQPPLHPVNLMAPPVEPAWHFGLRIFQKHWRASVGFALAMVAAVTVVTLMMKPVYEPVATIAVDPPGAEVFSMQGGAAGTDSTEYLETVVKSLRSDDLAVEMIRKLHLDTDPDFTHQGMLQRLIARVFGERKAPQPGSGEGGLQLTPAENAALRSLQDRMKVSRNTPSRLISVSVAAHDPTLAAYVTNSLVSQFIEREYQTRHDAVMQSSTWLQRQLDDIRLRMGTSNRLLADFQRSTGIAAIGENQNTFADQMSELNKQLMQAQADRIQLQSFLKRMNGEDSAGSLPQISSNVVVQQLTQKLAEVRADLAQTLAVYGKNHPKAKQLQNQADELQAQLTAQRANILSDLKTSYSAAQAREGLMQSKMASTGARLSLLAQYTALKKEADANTELYNTLYQKIREAGIAAESKSNNTRFVDRARVLDEPSRPHRLVNIALGLLAGILGGVVLAFLLEVLDTRIRTPEDIRKCLGTGSISIVPVFGDGAESSLRAGLRLLTRRRLEPLASPVFLLDRPRSPEAEALRGLYTSVRLSRQAGAHKVLLVVSPFHGEGKTTLAVNLGAALAQHGKTCLVDADLRKEGVGPALRVKVQQGLSNVLDGTLPIEQVLVEKEGVPNLTILPTGPTPADPGALISSARMAETVRYLRQNFEFVLIDSAPILPFADGRSLSALVDGVILVGRFGVTTREALVRAMESLQEVRSAPVLEVVLNAAAYPVIDRNYYEQYAYDRSA